MVDYLKEVERHRQQAIDFWEAWINEDTKVAPNKVAQQTSINNKINRIMIIERDWECEGALRIQGGDKTLKRYRELHESTWNLPINEWGLFFAFSDEQFERGRKEAKIKEGEKIYNYGSGMFGTHNGIKRYFAEIDAVNEKIKKECDPQEVYVYEYNNHECMLDWDGDDRAIELIIYYFGAEVAKSIRRFNVCHTVDEIIQEQEERAKHRRR